MSRTEDSGAHPEKVALQSIPGETIVLGFTGPIGSGCSELAKAIAGYEGLKYMELSAPVHELARRKHGSDHSFDVLQDIGNALRHNKGRDYLAVEALRRADDAWGKGPEKWHGIVLDGIRNTGEVEYLRQLPNFFLFAIHADTEVRTHRLLEIERIASRDEFERVDGRDCDERLSHGQEVKKCTYLSDVIVSNNTDIPAAAPDRKRTYILEVLCFQKYLALIKSLLYGKPTHEYTPTAREALMTTAYCMSRRSACIKRKVGAVIATERGAVLASGYNDVPEGQQPCVLDPALNECARDKLRAEYAGRLKYCPQCGAEIAIAFQCPNCNAHITSYVRRCPKCGSELELSYQCAGCGTAIFDEYLPGAQPAFGKLLDLCRSLHAEESAIINLAKHGGGVPPDSVLYTTTFPCNLCAQKIVAAGIKTVVFAEPYPMSEARALLNSSGVKTVKFEGVKSSAFFRLYV